MRIRECPICGADISDSYEGDDPETGIVAGYYCDACDQAVEWEDDDHDD